MGTVGTSTRKLNAQHRDARQALADDNGSDAETVYTFQPHRIATDAESEFESLQWEIASGYTDHLEKRAECGDVDAMCRLNDMFGRQRELRVQIESERWNRMESAANESAYYAAFG